MCTTDTELSETTLIEIVDKTIDFYRKLIKQENPEREQHLFCGLLNGFQLGSIVLHSADSYLKKLDRLMAQMDFCKRIYEDVLSEERQVAFFQGKYNSLTWVYNQLSSLELE